MALSLATADPWQVVGATLSDEFADVADLETFTRSVLRIVCAVVLGGLLGFEREYHGKSAGIRTHMLVALGAAMFIMVLQLDSAGFDALSRTIQGIAAGIGFLCAGTILKGEDLGHIKGLTTAASIWLTTAIGVAVGLGHISLALIATIAALLILNLLPRVIEHFEKKPKRLVPPAVDDPEAH